MSAPAWLAGGFAVVMIAIAACCAARLVISWLRGRDTERDADGLHVLMGVAMAGMLQPRLMPVPGAFWGAVFAAAAAWFGWRAARAGHRASRARRAHHGAHAVECAAMVYMLLPIGSWPSGRGTGMAMPGMSQGGAAGNPALTLLLATFMVGYVVWTIDRLAALSRPRVAVPVPASVLDAPPPSAALAPRLAACYKIAMGITMGCMLVMML
jgi:Domain of unknown function (DUF5134)